MASDPLYPSGDNPERLPSASNAPVPPPPLATGGTGLGSTDLSTAGTTDSGLAPNVAAGLAVILGLISGVVFLFLEKRNRFVRFWAMQAVFFGAAGLAYSILSRIIGAILFHIPLIGILWFLFSLLISIGFLVVYILMLIKAFGGKEWEVPFIGKLARQQIDKPPTL